MGKRTADSYQIKKDRHSLPESWSSSAQLLPSKNGSLHAALTGAAVDLSRSLDARPSACTRHRAPPYRTDEIRKLDPDHWPRPLLTLLRTSRDRLARQGSQFRSYVAGARRRPTVQ